MNLTGSVVMRPIMVVDWDDFFWLCWRDQNFKNNKLSVLKSLFKITIGETENSRGNPSRIVSCNCGQSSMKVESGAPPSLLHKRHGIEGKEHILKGMFVYNWTNLTTLNFQIALSFLTKESSSSSCVWRDLFPFDWRACSHVIRSNWPTRNAPLPPQAPRYHLSLPPDAELQSDRKHHMGTTSGRNSLCILSNMCRN